MNSLMGRSVSKNQKSSSIHEENSNNVDNIRKLAKSVSGTSKPMSGPEMPKSYMNGCSGTTGG
jgi:hypothetical protein